MHVSGIHNSVRSNYGAYWYILSPLGKNADSVAHRGIHSPQVIGRVYRLEVLLISGGCGQYGQLGVNSNHFHPFHEAYGISYVLKIDLKWLHEGWSVVEAVTGKLNLYCPCGGLEPEEPNKNIDTSLNDETSEGRLELETFYFEYPSLEAISGFMREGFSAALLLEDREYDLIMSSRIEYLDNFTLVSAMSLHTWTDIPREKIQVLYKCADVMIRAFHEEKRKDIEEIWEIRAVVHMKPDVDLVYY